MQDWRYRTNGVVFSACLVVESAIQEEIWQCKEKWKLPTPQIYEIDREVSQYKNFALNMIVERSTTCS